MRPGWVRQGRMQQGQYETAAELVRRAARRAPIPIVAYNRCMHRPRLWMWLVLLSCCLACCLTGASRSVWDGVYTKDQAGRGQTAYREECAKCHAANLMG